MNFIRIILTILVVTILYCVYKKSNKNQIESFAVKAWYPWGYRSTWWRRRHRWIAWWYPNFPGFYKAYWRWRDRDQGWGNRCSYIRLYLWNTSRQLLAYRAYRMVRSRSYRWRATWVTPNYRRSNKRIWRVGILISAYWSGCRAYTSHNYIKLYGRNQRRSCPRTVRNRNNYLRWYRAYVRHYRNILRRYRAYQGHYRTVLRQRNWHSATRNRYNNLYRQQLQKYRSGSSEANKAVQKYNRAKSQRDYWVRKYYSQKKSLDSNLSKLNSKFRNQINQLKIELNKLSNKVDNYDTTCRKQTAVTKEKIENLRKEFARFKRTEYVNAQRNITRLQGLLNKCKRESEEIVRKYKEKIARLTSEYEMKVARAKNKLEEAIRECKDTLRKNKNAVSGVLSESKNKLKSHIAQSRQVKV